MAATTRKGGRDWRGWIGIGFGPNPELDLVREDDADPAHKRGHVIFLTVRSPVDGSSKPHPWYAGDDLISMARKEREEVRRFGGGAP